MFWTLWTWPTELTVLKIWHSSHQTVVSFRQPLHWWAGCYCGWMPCSWCPQALERGGACTMCVSMSGVVVSILFTFCFWVLRSHMNRPPAGGRLASPILFVQPDFFISWLCLDEGRPGDVSPIVDRLPVVDVVPILAAAENANVLLDALHAMERTLCGEKSLVNFSTCSTRYYHQTIRLSTFTTGILLSTV